MMFGAGGGGVQGAETTQVSIPNNVCITSHVDAY